MSGAATRLLLGAARGNGGFSFPIPTYSVSTITAQPEGGWVWFVSQKAMQSGSNVLAGFIRDGGTGGDVRLVTIDAATRVPVSTSMLYDNFLDDDHEPPSVLVRGDGKIMVAFAYHVGELYVGVGPSAGVLPAQANVTNITSQVGTLSGGAGYTYASLVYLDDEDRFYVFFRYHNSSGVPYLGYTWRDGDGAGGLAPGSWAARTLVQQITYHHVVKNGTGRLDFALSDHPLFGQGDNPAVKTSIYHMYYESGTGWHKSDGTGLTPTIGNTAATLVYDGTTERAWMWDVAVDATGKPVIAFVIYENPFPSADWRYAYARWNGSAWVVNTDVADAGGAIAPTATPAHGNNYAGGIAIDPENPDRILYSSNATGAFQVYLGETADGGATWDVTQLTNDADKNVRPIWIRGHGSALQGLWLYGPYTDYFNYNQGIKGFGSP